MRQRRRFPVRSKLHSCTELTVARQSCKPPAELTVARQSCKPPAEPQVTTTNTATANIDANASATDLISVR